MRKNLPVTGKELNYSDDVRIVSTTTKKGVITYINKDFIDISGFSNDELLGQAHNLVRHPDMPQLAFKDLWDTVAKDQPWMGIVKNRCKNGDHYWVDAFVMPNRGVNQEESGLQSVRFKPDRAEINRAEEVYGKINLGKKPFNLLSPRHWPIFTKILSSGLCSFLPLILTSFSGEMNFSVFLLSLLTGILILAGSAYSISRPFVQSAKKAKALYQNDFGQFIYTGRMDELGAINLGNKFLSNHLETALWRVACSAQEVEVQADNSASVSRNTFDQMEKQTLELEQLATAMNEMVASIAEVSRNASDASDAVTQVHNMVEKGNDEVGSTKKNIDLLVKELISSSDKVKKISESSQSISTFVDDIHSIAEQTNLLALNAAIEAARAGEQGRGFAVVADEVRNLANNTAETTAKIQQAITGIRMIVDEAVGLMAQASHQSNQTIDQSTSAFELLQEVKSVANGTADLVIQIAAAAEEQSMVAEEINRNIHGIQDASKNSQNNMAKVQHSNDRLYDEVKKLQVVTMDFTL